MDGSDDRSELEPKDSLQNASATVQSDDDSFHISLFELVASSLCGLLFWLYGFINVFVVNTDTILRSVTWAGLYWLIDYKFLAVLAIVSILWLILGTRQFVFSVCFVVFFPLIAFCTLAWILGKRAFQSRSWIFVLAAIEALTSLLINFKVKFVSATIFFIAATYIMVGSMPSFIIAAACIILFFVFCAYVRSFMSAISPPNTFKFMRRFLDRDEEARFKAFKLDAEIRNKPITLLSSAELTKWNNGLQNSIIYNRSMLFYARTMRDYQRSNLLFMPGVFTIVRLTLFTVVGFALVNFAVYKVYPDNFRTSAEPGFFEFFYYSFNSLVLNGIDEIKPSKGLAQSLLMTQELLSFVLALILVSLFVSYRTQRASSDLDQAIEVAEQEAASIEGWLQREFKMASIANAIEHLRQAEGNLLGLIFWLSRGL